MNLPTQTTPEISIGTLAYRSWGYTRRPLIITAISANAKRITAHDIEFIPVHGPNNERGPGDCYYASKGELILGDILPTCGIYSLRKNGKYIPVGIPTHCLHKQLWIGDAIHRSNPEA